MGRDVVDVLISDWRNEHEITLVVECYCKVAHDLEDLYNRTNVILINEGAERMVQVHREDGDECAYPYIEVGPQIALALGLQDQSRYLIDYNSLLNAITLTRITLSSGEAVLGTDRKRGREPRITLGPALIATLGMGGHTNSGLTVSKNGVKLKAKLVIPENQFSDELLLSPHLIRKLRLSEGKQVPLSYHQRTKTLYMGKFTASSPGIPGNDELLPDASSRAPASAIRTAKPRKSSAGGVRKPFKTASSLAKPASTTVTGFGFGFGLVDRSISIVKAALAYWLRQKGSR